MRILIAIICAIISIINTPIPKLSAQSNSALNNKPKLIEEPGLYYKYSTDSRKFTGIPSMTISEKGRMWAVWYAGPTPGEDHNNYIVVATSKDKGTTWKEILAIDPDGKGPIRSFDPQVWIDPNGELWVFWAQETKDYSRVDGGLWAIRSDDVDNEYPQWSSPERIAEGAMMNKPIVLSDGDWALPVATWGTQTSSKMIVSSDKGETWVLRGGCNIPKEFRNADEHIIIEKKDHSLWMLVRVKNHDVNETGIWECHSDNVGKTWSNATPSDIQHPTARFFIRRLDSGNLLLVKHGPISIKTGRSHLMAFISKDDGKTWSKGLLLDGRNGISYPDGVQADNGTIYITYDYSRTGGQKIFMISFREEDILSEKYDEKIIDIFRSRKVISDGGR